MLFRLAGLLGLARLLPQLRGPAVHHCPRPCSFHHRPSSCCLLHQESGRSELHDDEFNPTDIISVPDGAPSGTASGGIENPAYTVAAPNTRTAGGPVLNPSMDNVGKTSEGGVSGLSQPPLVSIANAKTNQVQSKKARHRHG